MAKSAKPRFSSPYEARKRLGLTQKEMAALIRVPVRRWQRWEAVDCKTATPLPENVRLLLEILLTIKGTRIGKKFGV